jgi:C4-dicarboxylate transporter DctQ subunit
MKILDHLEEWFIAFLMGAATLVIFFAVVHRYASGLAIPGLQDLLLQINTSWAQELTIYLFVWMAKFGAAYGVRTGIHVGVDVLVNRLPTPMQRRFILFGLLAGALFTGIIAALGAEFVIERSATSSTSEVMEVPIWVVYLAIPVGSALMCARFLQVAWQFVRGAELPSHDHSHVDGLENDVAESKP